MPFFRTATTKDPYPILSWILVAVLQAHTSCFPSKFMPGSEVEASQPGQKFVRIISGLCHLLSLLCHPDLGLKQQCPHPPLFCPDLWPGKLVLLHCTAMAWSSPFISPPLPVLLHLHWLLRLPHYLYFSLLGGMPASALQWKYLLPWLTERLVSHWSLL